MTTYLFKADGPIADAIIDLSEECAMIGMDDEQTAERIAGFLANVALMHPDECWAEPEGTIH
jgi:hypothetical protein